MDADTDLITGNGFSNCLTRDGQGFATANLPMGAFRHTGVGNGVAATDYGALGQVQSGLPSWAIAGGSSDALTATFSPAITSLVDGQIFCVRALSANATTTPTFAPNSLTAHTITKNGGAALAASDIAGDFAEIILRYNLANTRYELLNPSNASFTPGIATTGFVSFTVASTPPTGWLMFDDGTFGSASSGSSNSNSAANQALFNILYASPFTDATCPLLTSSGAGTTRSAQGTAAAAWAANCRMTLPKMLGHALGVAGAGSGLTSRTMGVSVGTETQTLITANLPPYTPSATLSGSVTTKAADSTALQGTGGAYEALVPNGSGTNTNNDPTFVPIVNTLSIVGTPQGGTSTAFSIIPPEQFLNAIVKQ
jgi:hypothetical protein